MEDQEGETDDKQGAQNFSEWTLVSQIDMTQRSMCCRDPTTAADRLLPWFLLISDCALVSTDLFLACAQCRKSAKPKHGMRPQQRPRVFINH